MTPNELRTYFSIATLPPSLHPIPALHIVDLPKFVDTNLARLDCESPRLQKLAGEVLNWLIEKLENQTAHE